MWISGWVDMKAKKEFREKFGKIKRNDKCPCGSGKKFKKCCGINEGFRHVVEKNPN